MQRVNIYIGTEDTLQKEATRWTAYVLECEFRGETETREKFMERTGTYNAVVLQTLAEALGRIRVKCEIHIYSENLFVLNTIKDQLPQMAERNFCTKNGTPCIIRGAIIPEGRQACPSCEWRTGRKSCATCKYHDDFTWVCSNGDSARYLEFTTHPEYVCEGWEQGGQTTAQSQEIKQIFPSGHPAIPGSS